MRRRVAETEELNKELRKQVEEQSRVVQDLQDDLSTLANHIEKIEEQCRALRFEKEQYQQTVDALEDEIVRANAAKADNDAILESYRTLQAQYEQLHERYERAVEQERDTQQLLDVQIGQNEQLRDQLDRLEGSREKTEASSPIATAASSNDDAERVTRYYQRKLVKTLQKVKTLEGLNLELKLQVEQERQRDQDQQGSWKQEYEALQRDCRRTALQLEAMQLENDRLSRQQLKKRGSVLGFSSFRSKGGGGGGSVVVAPEQLDVQEL